MAFGSAPIHGAGLSQVCSRRDAPGTDSEPIEAFRFLDPVESLCPGLRVLRDGLSRNYLFLALGELIALAGPIRVRRLATFARAGNSNSGWRFKRIYLSYQPEGLLPRSGFRGHTFFCRPKRGQLWGATFPEDGGLPSADWVVNGLERAAAAGGMPVEVLRYVPMRRLTLRGTFDRAEPLPAIVKVVEGPAAGLIVSRLGAVAEAVACSGASFHVATVIDCKVERGMFVQQYLPGRQIAQEIGPDNLDGVLRRVGEIHAEIHTLCVAGPHVGAVKDPWPTVAERLDWLAFIRPGHAGLLGALAARLMAARPAPGEPVFCHGDFRCTQILADGDQWSVIDFDDSGYGEAGQDVGRFLAFLKYDVPVLAASPVLLERAETAYLEGYAGRARGAPAPATLSWHRLCQEVLYLSQMVRRDLIDENGFDQGCAELDRLSARLRPGEFRQTADR